MKVLKVFIPGEFDSVYLYAGKLVYFTRSSQIGYMDLRQLAYNLHTQYPSTAPFFEWAFYKNAWLTNEQSRSMLENKILKRYFDKWLNQVSEWCPTTGLPAPKESIFAPTTGKFDTVLDSLIYNGRIYYATEDSVFHLDTSFTGNKIAWPTQAKKRLDLKAVSLSARFGALNVSCAQEGLFNSLREFDPNGEPAPEPINVFKCSWKTDWCSHDIVSYDAKFQPSLLRTEKTKGRKPGAMREKEPHFLEKISGVKDSLAALQTSLPNDVADNLFKNASLFFNLNQNFYGVVAGNKLESVWLKYRQPRNKEDAEPDPIVEAHRNKLHLQNFVENPITTYPMPIHDGVVVETFNTVSLLSSQGQTSLLNQPAVSVKTYPRSIDYQNLVTVVVEDGVWLICVINDQIRDLGLKPTQLKLPEAAAPTTQSKNYESLFE